MKTVIEQTLHNLGVTRNYRGYRCTLVAVELVLENEDCMVNMMQGLYAPVAEVIGCPRHSIERNIRTVINRVWNTNRPLLFKLAGFPMVMQPTVGEFIDIISTHIIRTCRTQVK